MTNTHKLQPYSIGVGDRFGRQGVAQLRALQRAGRDGLSITPVWNKSRREHDLIGSQPQDARRAADEAVQAAGWQEAYFVDADHINAGNVDPFIAWCDFFTIDVAEAIGRPADGATTGLFIQRYEPLIGALSIVRLHAPIQVTRADLEDFAGHFLVAVQAASDTYRAIAAQKGSTEFVTEISMDETKTPQSPLQLYFILAELARLQVPVQTIAPKFSGAFHKGVDYIGDIALFEREFRQDLAVVAHAVRAFNLPPDLKLSVHSGSDKFSIYGPIHAALKEFGAGLHLKTAGTTWLEEVIGLAQAGGSGLEIVKSIYALAYQRREELIRPYLTVTDINPVRLPAPEEVNRWTGTGMVAALRHDPACAGFKSDMRQLMHLAYKVAAEMGPVYYEALAADQESIAENVTDNLYRRHLAPVFLGVNGSVK